MSTFDTRAQNWDNGDIRVNGANKIADAIRAVINLNKEMEIIDFGTGTGLLGFSIAPSVKHIYGIDTSAKMLKKLQEKNKEPLKQEFNGLISSMTLHHVEDLEAFFKTIFKNIKKDGFIAIADLEDEDGTFHSDNRGVHHFGFKEDELFHIVQKSGFKDIQIKNINTIKNHIKSEA